MPQISDPKEGSAATLMKRFEHRMRRQKLKKVREGFSTSHDSSLAPSRQASIFVDLRTPDSRSCRLPPRSFVLLPISPVAPLNNNELRFDTKLRSLAQAALAYEKPDLLDKALHVIPVDQIVRRAEEYELLNSEGMGNDQHSISRWGYTDLMIRALMRYGLSLPFPAHRLCY